MLRQLPAALKLYDRLLDITPTDPNMMAAKAGIYQARVTCKSRQVPTKNRLAVLSLAYLRRQDDSVET